MKRFAIIIMMGISSIPALSQIKGLDDYQRSKSYEEIDSNEGIRFYYKPNSMAYLAYSCYIIVEPDSLGNYLLIEDDCAITKQNVIDVYDELIRVLHENGVKPENYDELTGTNNVSFENIYNATLLDGEPIFIHYSIGAAKVYFLADKFSVELQMMDRKSRKRIFNRE
jgi:hypothetical protein